MRLGNLVSVRRYLAKTIKRLEDGEIPDGRARTIAYLCQVMAGIMKDADLEVRLQKLEEMEANRHDNQKPHRQP